MQNQKGSLILTVFLIIVFLAVMGSVGYIVYEKSITPKSEDKVPPMDATNYWQKTYMDGDYGFEITFTDSWKGYIVEEKRWEGVLMDVPDSEGPDYGPMFVFKNPKSTTEQRWQDIPIMIFTQDVWKMVDGPNPTVSVSAAPIGPAKIGENSKYVFATPPRWYGFTDDLGWEEAVEIVKTFKAFQIY